MGVVAKTEVFEVDCDEEVEEEVGEVVENDFVLFCRSRWRSSNGDYGYG